MTGRSGIALLLMTLSPACTNSYRVDRQYFDGPRALADTLPALRERDGAHVLLRASSVRPDLVDPGADVATLRVRHLGTEHPAFRAGLGLTVAGAVLTVVGAGVLGFGLAHTQCNDESGQCTDPTSMVLPGLAILISGMGLGSIVGPIMMSVGANVPAHELGASR